MPFETTWVPAPRDENIPLLKELPEGVFVQCGPGIMRAYGHVDYVLRWFYWCDRCKGWVEGQPLTSHEDTMGILCGRRGIATNCIRCGEELEFDGMIA